MDEGADIIRWEVCPFDDDSILPVVLLLWLCGLIAWTIFAVLIFNGFEILIVLLVSWAMTALMFYWIYSFVKAELISYGYRIIGELEATTGPATNKV